MEPFHTLTQIYYMSKKNGKKSGRLRQLSFKERECGRLATVRSLFLAPVAFILRSDTYSQVRNVQSALDIHAGTLLARARPTDTNRLLRGCFRFSHGRLELHFPISPSTSTTEWRRRFEEHRTMRKYEDCWVVDRTMFEYVNQVTCVCVCVCGIYALLCANI